MADSKIEQALDQVLADGDLVRYFHYTGPSDTVVGVAEVRARIGDLVGPVRGLEAKVDAAVEARGGEKLEVLDFKKEVKDLAGRLIGHSPDPDEEMYRIPSDAEGRKPA